MAYKRLSPVLQSMIEKVKVVHTSEKMINHTRGLGGMVRNDPIDSTHPLVRVHPVTGEKAIFLNQEFKKDVIGLKDLEAECITKFLMDSMVMGHDYQARIHWQKHSVVMVSFCCKRSFLNRELKNREPLQEPGTLRASMVPIVSRFPRCSRVLSFLLNFNSAWC